MRPAARDRDGMEAKTMTSEIGRGSAEPSPVTSVDEGHVRPERPDATLSEPASASPERPAVASSVEPTGDERVDEELARLGELAGLPVARHVEVFEDVHRGLQDVLTGIDQENPAPTGPPVPRPPGPVGPVGPAGRAPAGRPGGS
jgi:hypothetical protein